MKKLVFLLIFLFSFAAKAEEQFVEPNISAVIQRFKNILKTNNPQLIAKHIIYPYSMGHGVPEIKNEQEFIEKYNIILPQNLRMYLIDTPLENWSFGGNLGGICLNYCPDAHLTDDGQIMGLKKSKELHQYREEYIAAEKQIIHPSLKSYNYNLYTMETQNWLIRIDDMKGLYKQIIVDENYNENYRFAAWKKGKNISDKPDIIIDHGIKNAPSRWEGHEYTFIASEYYAVFTDNSESPRPTDFPKYTLHLYKSILNTEPNIK